MSLFYGNMPDKMPVEVKPSELDPNKLIELRNKCIELIECIKAERDDIKKNHQDQTIQGIDLSTKMNPLSRAAGIVISEIDYINTLNSK